MALAELLNEGERLTEATSNHWISCISVASIIRHADIWSGQSLEGILTSTEFITVSEQWRANQWMNRRSATASRRATSRNCLARCRQRCAPSIASFCRCQGDAFTIQKTEYCENSAIKFRNFIGSESYTRSWKRGAGPIPSCKIARIAGRCALCAPPAPEPETI